MQPQHTTSATAPREQLVRETRLLALGAVVVTYRSGAAYETRIDGGRLDGWTLTAARLPEARRCHDGAVRLAKEAAHAP